MDTLITTLVDGVLVPLLDALVTPIPFLASSGLLLLVFAALWVAFGVAIARDPARLDTAWTRLRRLPLVVQALAWLALLPVLAGLWIWRTGWPPRRPPRARRRAGGLEPPRAHAATRVGAAWASGPEGPGPASPGPSRSPARRGPGTARRPPAR